MLRYRTSTKEGVDMNNLSKLLKFAEACLGVVRKTIPEYSSKFSRKDYTQHQLMTLVCLMRKYKPKYRDFVEILEIATGRVVDYVFLSKDASVVKEVIARPPEWGYMNLNHDRYEAQICRHGCRLSTNDSVYSIKELRERLANLGILSLPPAFEKVIG